MQLFGPGASSLLRQGCAEIVELAEKDELIQHVHLLVEAALLRQVANAAEDAAGERLVEERDRARVGDRDADHHSDGTGLARAVGPEQSEHDSRLDGEGEVRDGDFGVVDLANMFKLNDGHADSNGLQETGTTKFSSAAQARVHTTTGCRRLTPFGHGKLEWKESNSGARSGVSRLDRKSVV